MANLSRCIDPYGQPGRRFLLCQEDFSQSKKSCDPIVDSYVKHEPLNGFLINRYNRYE